MHMRKWIALSKLSPWQQDRKQEAGSVPFQWNGEITPENAFRSTAVWPPAHFMCVFTCACVWHVNPHTQTSRLNFILLQLTYVWVKPMGGSWVFLEQGNNPTVINTSCGAEDHTHSARSSTNVHSSLSESDAAHALRCPNMSFFSGRKSFWRYWIKIFDAQTSSVAAKLHGLDSIMQHLQ